MNNMPNLDPEMIQKIQEQSLALQHKVTDMRVEGKAGSDDLQVVVVINGKHEAISVQISPALLTQSINVLQETVAAAITDAAHKVEIAMQKEVMGVFTNSVN